VGWRRGDRRESIMVLLIVRIEGEGLEGYVEGGDMKLRRGNGEKGSGGGSSCCR